MSSILIVEDGLDTQVLLRKALAGVVGNLVIASTLAEARAQVATAGARFDLILLDLQLPDGDGLEFCGELQGSLETRLIPILILTGKREVSDKVAAFAIGADDYIEKPFKALELRARVEGKLKRAALHREGQATLTRGRLRLDLATLRASIQDPSGALIPIHLSPLEFKLLFHLARHVDRAFTRDQLLSAVWGENSEVLDRTVDATISAIRKKLGSLSSCIESVPGQGYRFLVETESL